MTTSYKNRLVCTVSAVAGSGLGAFTVSTASSGYVTFAAGDDAKTFDIVAVEGAAWEVLTGCTYTHSGTSLSRGTLEASSTGSAITFTSAVVLAVTPSAAKFAALDLLLDSAYTFVQNAAASSQSFAAAATTKVTTMGSVQANPYTWWDTTNNKFLPTRAGTYLILVGAQMASGVTLIQPAIYKNGSVESYGAIFEASPGGGQMTSIVSLNGSTDYVEFYLYSGTTRSNDSSAGRVYFKAIYLGP